MRIVVTVTCVVILAVMLAPVAATRASAAGPTGADFYKGRVITYVVSTKPAGGYDTCARLIGRYMQKYIPGSTIIIKNVPGAGHIVGANETYHAKPDGLTIGTFSTGLIYAQIIGLEGVSFDLTKLEYIGKATSEPRVLLVSSKAPYKTSKDFFAAKETIKLGSQGVGSEAHNEILMMIAATGANHIKPIPGYGGSDTTLGMLRGEISGSITSYDSAYRVVTQGEGRLLLQFSNKKSKDLGDVPLAKDLNISDKGKRLLNIVSNIGEIGRLTAAPPKTPGDRLAVLREAYRKAITDPELLKEAEKLGFGVDPLYGGDVLNLVKEALNQPPENLSLLKQIIKVEQ